MSIIIKMDPIQTEEHLTRAIHYIMQEKKTKGMVLSNSGTTPDEVTDTFILTKQRHPSRGKRQGYHFKFSFSKDETISKEDALLFIREWTERYLGDDYDYVMSVHHDRDHTHMHLLFNATKRPGGKYHYQKGDWETIIKPITNDLCKKYHTNPLKEKEKQLDYSSSKNWKGLVEKDIAECVKKSKSYSDFKNKMITDFGYELREGVSREHGIYLALKPFGKAKAIRTYQLNEQCQPSSIEKQIKAAHISSPEVNPDVILCRIIYRTVTGYRTPYVPYQRMNDYQKHFARKVMDARRLYQRTGSSLKMHEDSVRAMKRLQKDMAALYDMKLRKDIPKTYKEEQNETKKERRTRNDGRTK